MRTFDRTIGRWCVAAAGDNDCGLGLCAEWDWLAEHGRGRLGVPKLRRRRHSLDGIPWPGRKRRHLLLGRRSTGSRSGCLLAQYGHTMVSISRSCFRCGVASDARQYQFAVPLRSSGNLSSTRCGTSQLGMRGNAMAGTFLYNDTFAVHVTVENYCRLSYLSFAPVCCFLRFLSRSCCFLCFQGTDLLLGLQSTNTSIDRLTMKET